MNESYGVYDIEDLCLTREVEVDNTCIVIKYVTILPVGKTRKSHTGLISWDANNMIEGRCVHNKTYIDVY